MEEQEEDIYHLLFTGHMIDEPDRKEPRFPPTKEIAVRRKIKEVVTAEKNRVNAELKGIAGGACGGDILFHEICEELGIKTELYLALGVEQFIAESIAFAGANWVERFNQLYNKLPHHFLPDEKRTGNIWEQNNKWQLHDALINGGVNMTLIALWDGNAGDGTGGTEHMIQEAAAKKARIIVIDINLV